MKDFWGKLEKGWLWIFLLLIPTQLGKHFWPEWSYLSGVRVDYLSPTLYLIDVVWAGLAVIIIKDKRLDKKLKISKRMIWGWILFLTFVGLNIWAAERWQVALYRWLRWGQLGISWWYLSKGKINWQKMMMTIIPCWLILEGWLGLMQVIRGGSLQGIFYWLGERRFSYATPGIAQISFLGEGWVRAYGTFSHPNSLAGFLLVVMIWWESQKKEADRKIWWWLGWWSGLMGIVLTGSRVVWVLAWGYWLFRWFKKERKFVWGRILMAGILLVSLAAVININYEAGSFLGGWDRESFNKRWELNQIAWEMGKSSPLLGVGAGNFLVELPAVEQSYRWWQPAHNIPLLVFSETGIIGISFLIYLTYLVLIKNLKFKIQNYWVFLVIAVTGMVDHYWLTLPQNWWLLVLIVASK